MPKTIQIRDLDDDGTLFGVVAGTPAAGRIRERWMDADDLAAPHIIDVEVSGLIREHALRSRLDPTAARIAVAAVRARPGLRFPHQPLLGRGWSLRANVRGWDAMYVALAESLDVPLMTTDRRLASAPGPTCPFEVVP